MLRKPPVDPFEKVAELRRRDRHPPVRVFAGSRRRPDEAASFQPLREQAHPLSIVPKDLDQPATTTAEHEQMPVVRIALERLLHQQRQAIESLRQIAQPWPGDASC